MAIHKLTEQDWSSSNIMASDGKLNGIKDGKVNEEEYVRAVSEATSGQVSEEDARRHFNDLVGNTPNAGTDETGQAALTVDDLGKLSGDIQGHIVKMNESLIANSSLFGLNGTDEEIKPKFDAMDQDKDGIVQKNDFIYFVKNSGLNGDKLSDAELADVYDQVAARGDGKGSDTDMSYEEFKDAAPQIQNTLNKIAATPPTELEQIRMMFQELITVLTKTGNGNLF